MGASASSEPEFTAVPGALPEIRALIESSRRRVVATANLEMVVLYWNIGRIIARDGGRATHGKQLVERLAVHLARQYGRGFSSANLWAMRRFYDAFVIPQTVSAELTIGSALLAPKGENADNERIALDFEQHSRRVDAFRSGGPQPLGQPLLGRGQRRWLIPEGGR